MSIISTNSVIKKQGANLKKLDKQAILLKAVQNSEEKITEAQRLQLRVGEGKDGAKISPSYANPSYSKKKNTMNPLAGKGNPDLKLTGDLWEYLFVTTDSQNYFIKSKVDYFTELANKYTTAFGLSKKNAESSGVQNEYFKLIHEAINK